MSRLPYALSTGLILALSTAVGTESLFASNAPALASMAGEWATNGGVVILRQSGSSVTGTYSSSEGVLDGQIEGNRLVGYMAEKSSPQRCKTERLGTFYWGRFEWTFSPDGKRFTGKWALCER